MLWVEVVVGFLFCGGIFILKSSSWKKKLKNTWLLSTLQSRARHISLNTQVQNKVNSPGVGNVQGCNCAPLVLLHFPLWGLLQDFTNRTASNSHGAFYFLILFWPFWLLFSLCLILASDFPPSLRPLKCCSRYCQTIIYSSIIVLCTAYYLVQLFN